MAHNASLLVADRNVHGSRVRRQVCRPPRRPEIDANRRYKLAFSHVLVKNQIGNFDRPQPIKRVGDAAQERRNVVRTPIRRVDKRGLLNPAFRRVLHKRMMSYNEPARGAATSRSRSGRAVADLVVGRPARAPPKRHKAVESPRGGRPQEERSPNRIRRVQMRKDVSSDSGHEFSADLEPNVLRDAPGPAGATVSAGAGPQRRRGAASCVSGQGAAASRAAGTAVLGA